jgi:acyl-coenzyme A thioesterase PaaI-like protein
MTDTPHYTRTIWGNPEPGHLIGRGHPIGDFLEAYRWKLCEERAGFFRVEAALIDAVKNYRGQLFGGFAPTYVDLAALRTVSAGRSLDVKHGWLVTLNMRVDFIQPVDGPTFFIESELRNRRGRTLLIETRFLDGDSTLLLFAITTLRET